MQNHILESTKKTVGGVKDQVASFKEAHLKIVVNKPCYSRVKKLSKPNTLKQPEENIIKSIRSLFKLKK